MLVHIGQSDVAENVHNAWLKTLEDGVHTYDIYKEGVSTQKVGTKEFANAVVERLGQKPQKLKAVTYNKDDSGEIKTKPVKSSTGVKQETIGVDVFLYWNKGTPDELGAILEKLMGPDFKLSMISNRGVKVWPNGFPETFCVDHWRCRFLDPNSKPITLDKIVSLLDRVNKAGLTFIKTENLCTMDGERSYSLGQGE